MLVHQRVHGTSWEKLGTILGIWSTWSVFTKKIIRKWSANLRPLYWYGLILLSLWVSSWISAGFDRFKFKSRNLALPSPSFHRLKTGPSRPLGNAILAWSGRDATSMWDKIPGDESPAVNGVGMGRNQQIVTNMWLKPPMTGNDKFIPPLKMVMTGGWFMALF